MGGKGGSKHLKRLAAPRSWPIPRKEKKWIVKPIPGPHGIEGCLPLQILIRDILKLVETRRELKMILSNKKVLVDKKPRTKPKYPVGLMDVVEIPDVNKAWRIVCQPRKGLVPVEVSEDEKAFKLCKITGKSILRGNQLQLNLHDGRNIVVSDENERKEELSQVKIRDVLKISIPDQELLETIEFKENNLVLVTSGKHAGQFGKLQSVIKRFGPQANTIIIESEGGTFETRLDYAFLLGETESIIKLK